MYFTVNGLTHVCISLFIFSVNTLKGFESIVYFKYKGTSASKSIIYYIAGGEDHIYRPKKRNNLKETTGKREK